MRLNDAITGLALVIFAIAEIAYSYTFPSLHGQAYGPSLFPILIGCGLLLCGVMLMVRGVRARRLPNTDDNHWVQLGEWASEPGRRLNMMLVPGLLIAYILFSDVVGFSISCVIILSLLLYRFGTSLIPSLLYAIATTAVLQLLFARVLLVPLPAGIARFFIE